MRQAPRRTPERTCIGCRRKRHKPRLIRIARTPDGVIVDPDHRAPGRGAYVCPDPRCVTAVAERQGQSLRRALRGAPEDEVRSVLDQLHGSRAPDPTAREERGNA